MVGQLIENLSGKKLESCEITCLTLSGQPQPREDCWLRWPVSQESLFAQANSSRKKRTQVSTQPSTTLSNSPFPSL